MLNMNNLIFKQNIHQKIQSGEYEIEDVLFMLEVRERYNFNNHDLIGFLNHVYLISQKNKKLHEFKKSIKHELILENNTKLYEIINQLIGKKELSQENKKFFLNLKEEVIINQNIKEVFKEEYSDILLQSKFMDGDFDMRHIKQLEEYNQYYEMNAIKIQYYILEAFKYIYALSYQDGFLNKLEITEIAKLNNLYELSIQNTNNLYELQTKSNAMVYPELSLEFIEEEFNNIRNATTLLTNRFIKTYALTIDNELKEDYGTLPKSKILVPYKTFEVN